MSEQDQERIRLLEQIAAVARDLKRNITSGYTSYHHVAFIVDPAAGAGQADRLSAALQELETHDWTVSQSRTAE